MESKAFDLVIGNSSRDIVFEKKIEIKE